jgi:hypothetical protein
VGTVEGFAHNPNPNLSLNLNPSGFSEAIKKMIMNQELKRKQRRRW